MNRIAKSFVRQALLTSVILGYFSVSVGWTMPMTGSIFDNEGTAYEFSNIPANLQILCLTVTCNPAGVGSSTQTTVSSEGVAEIKGTGGTYTINSFQLLITVTDINNFTSFTIDPTPGPSGPDGSGDEINIIQSLFTTGTDANGTVSLGGNTPGDGSFTALGAVEGFALINLGCPGCLGTPAEATHTNGLGSFDPQITFGWEDVPLGTSFIVFGATIDNSNNNSGNNGQNKKGGIFNNSGTYQPELVLRSPLSASLTVGVPEPSTLLLIGSGLVALGIGTGRRRSRRD